MFEFLRKRGRFCPQLDFFDSPKRTANKPQLAGKAMSPTSGRVAKLHAVGFFFDEFYGVGRKERLDKVFGEPCSSSA